MSKQKPASERVGNIVPFGLRMPPDLKQRVESRAEINRRSLNAEIVAALEEAYPAPVLQSDEAMAEWLAQIENSASLDEMEHELAKLNRFLQAGPNMKHLEAVIDPHGTSPRRSGRAVVIRLKGTL